MEIPITMRGYPEAHFTDLSGLECSLRGSSRAPSAVWFGVDVDLQGRQTMSMHLSREHVAALLPMLQRFVDSGFIV